MFEKLSDNLNLLMREMDISADELARRTLLPASTIKKIRNRYNPNPTLTTLMPLANFFSLTLGQLVGEEELPSTRIKGQYKVLTETVQHLPLLEWSAIMDSSSHSLATRSISTENSYSEKAFALIIEEDGWENLPRGTLLLVDPLLKPMHRDFVIIHKKDQSLPTLKQMLIDEENIYLKPVIEGYHITLLTPNHCILGVVVEYKKNLRITKQIDEEKIL